MSPTNNWSQDKRLWSVLGLNLLMVAGLLLVGIFAHSLGVLAAGGDYISDAAAIAISLFALNLSRHEHRHPRAKSYAALINVLFMLTVTVLVFYGSLHRLLTHVPEIQGLPVFIMSTIGSAAMVLGAYILANGKDNDLNMRAVLLDTTADAAFGAGVAAVGLIVFFTHRFYVLDPVVALVIACVIFYHAADLLHQVIKELQKPSAVS